MQRGNQVGKQFTVGLDARRGRKNDRRQSPGIGDAIGFGSLIHSGVLSFAADSHSYSPQQIRSIGDRHHEQHGAHGDFIGVI